MAPNSDLVVATPGWQEMQTRDCVLLATPGCLQNPADIWGGISGPGHDWERFHPLACGVDAVILVMKLGKDGIRRKRPARFGTIRALPRTPPIYPETDFVRSTGHPPFRLLADVSILKSPIRGPHADHARHHRRIGDHPDRHAERRKLDKGPDALGYTVRCDPCRSAFRPARALGPWPPAPAA